MGDRKPSQFLRYLRSLAPDIPNDYLRILWTSRLPTNIRTILAGLPEVELEAAALCADRIVETTSAPTVASTSPRPDHTELLQIIRDLPHQWRLLQPSGTVPIPRISTLTQTIFAPTHEVAPFADLLLDVTLPTPCDGTTEVTETGHNVVPSPAPSASKSHQRRRTSTLRPLTASLLPTRPASADASSTQVPISACTLESSSHNADHVLTTISARLTALPSPHMDGCLLT
jgi:hypothetical protein